MSPAWSNTPVNSPDLFFASVVLAIVSANAAAQSVNRVMRGPAAERSDNIVLYNEPMTPPSLPIVSLFVFATESKFFRLSVDVIVFDTSIAARPSCLPVSPRIVLNLGNRLVAKLPTAISSAGKRSLPAEAFNSSNLGLRSAIYLAKCAASFERPAVGSAPAPPPPAPFPALASSSSFCALASSMIAFFCAFSASVTFSCALRTSLEPSTPAALRFSVSFVRSAFLSFARRRLRSASAYASSASFRAALLGGKS